MSVTQTNGRAPRVPLAVSPVPELAPVAAALSTPSLDAAVLRVQAEAPKLIANADGRVGPRTYRYVTNDALVDAILPLLVKEDLLWRTFPTTHEDGSPALRYRMTHIPSGQSDEDVMKLACVLDPQGQGSGLTYARRYALVAYLNLTVDVDDDGAGAMPTGQPPVDRYAEAAAVHAELITNSNGIESGASPQPSARPAQRSERAITANQRTKLLIPRAQKAGLSDGEFANVLLTAAGSEPREWRSEDHAASTLSRLLDRFPARLKEQALEGIAEAAQAKGQS